MRAILCVLMLTTPTIAAAPPTDSVDDHGDPLPNGAIARLGSVRWHLASNTRNLTWSPDGKWIASSNALIDAKSGLVVRRFGGSGERASFTPDSKALVGPANDDTVHIWEVATGKLLGKLSGFRVAPNAAAFSQDGKTITVLGQERLVIRFDAASREEISRFTLPECTKQILSPHGDWVAYNTGFPGRNLVVCEAASGRILFESNTPMENPEFSPDGQLIAGREGKATLVRRTSDGAIVCELPTTLFDLRFSPDGKGLLTRQVR